MCLWLDCDREGENICFEVLRVCEPVMAPHPRGPKAQRIFRAKFSSLVRNDSVIFTLFALAGVVSGDAGARRPAKGNGQSGRSKR